MTTKISSKMIKYMFHGWSPTKASLAVLKEKRIEFLNELDDIRNRNFQGKDAPSQEEILRLEREWEKKASFYWAEAREWDKRVQNAHVKNIGVFDVLFNTENAKRQRALYENEVQSYVRKREEATKEKEKYERLRVSGISELTRKANEFRRTERAIEIIEEFIEKKEREQEKKQQIQNELAKTRLEKRAIAKVIKPGIPKNKTCPYCGSVLDYTDPDMVHLDHIYPLSKGGQSTIKNLVYVCSDCNLRKGQLTLHYFIKKYGLDKEKIEEALESLNKDF